MMNETYNESVNTFIAKSSKSFDKIAPPSTFEGGLIVPQCGGTRLRARYTVGRSNGRRRG